MMYCDLVALAEINPFFPYIDLISPFMTATEIRLDHSAKCDILCPLGTRPSAPVCYVLAVCLAQQLG